VKTIERAVFLVVGPVDGKVRVDAYVATNAAGISRTLVGDKDTRILVDGKDAKRSRPVKEGQAIEVRWIEQCFEGIEPQNIPLDILYEDDDVLVINKPQGMVVHPAAGNPAGTLVNALVYRYGSAFSEITSSPYVPANADSSFGDVQGRPASCVEEEPSSPDDVDFAVGGEETVDGLLNPAVRPGIVHRLDKDTSGVMVIARNRESHAALSRQFKEHTTDKYYIAIVKGRMETRRGRIVTGIKRDTDDRKRFMTCPVDDGRKAETHYLVLRQYAGYALVRIRILTGRTHQIRVHMQSIGHSVLGDPVYARKDGSYPGATLMLHSLQLQFDHPATGRRMRFCAPMPQRFKDVLRALSLPKVLPGDETRFLE